MIWLDNDIITGHSLYPRFGQTLSDISNRDYPNRNYIKESIETLDLDSYETSLSGNNDHTVDAVVGICNERQGKPCHRRHLLVELRMNYKSTDNLSSTDINQKDIHSRDLLRKCSDHTPVDSSLCLLFDPSIENEATRWNFKKQGEHSYAAGWLVFSPSSFCNYVNAGIQMPYTTRQETVNVVNRLLAAFNPQDFRQLEEEFKFFRNYLTECRNRYEKGECKSLYNGMATLSDQLRTWAVVDQDMALEREIFVEDLETLMRSYSRWLDSTM